MQQEEDLDGNAFAAKVVEAYRRIAPLVPDIDPQDLLLILHSMLRPPGGGNRYFLRELAPGAWGL